MSRQALLALLRAQPDAFLSGEQLSSQLGLSRAAVWKSVETLRKAGYDIEARTGLGYRLISAPDALTEAEIRAALAGETPLVGGDLICLSQVDSTNSYLKQLALSGAPDGTAAAADCQTAGRGRMERSFQSPGGKGVYLSVLLRPSLPPERLLPVTALGAVAVCDAVERVCGVRPGIKWTNDLVLGGKKICGILTEMSLEGESGALQYLVMGVGVNVRQTPEDFSPEVREMATSLSAALGRSVSRPALAAAELSALDRMYAALRRGDTAPWLERYRRDCVTLGKQVQLLGRDGTRRCVTAVDVDEAFGLVVRDGEGSVSVVRSGEVSVRGMYGYVE